MTEKNYNHIIDVENEKYVLYFATDDEELFKNMKMFIGTNCKEWWI